MSLNRNLKITKSALALAVSLGVILLLVVKQLSFSANEVSLLRAPSKGRF